MLTNGDPEWSWTHLSETGYKDTIYGPSYYNLVAVIIYNTCSKYFGYKVNSLTFYSLASDLANNLNSLKLSGNLNTFSLTNLDSKIKVSYTRFNSLSEEETFNLEIEYGFYGLVITDIVKAPSPLTYLSIDVSVQIDNECEELDEQLEMPWYAD